MTATSIPTMVVDDVELRALPWFQGDPIDCSYVWESHLRDTGRAYCPRSGSFAHWVNGPRTTEESSS